MMLRRSSPWNPLLGFIAAGAALTFVVGAARADEIRVPLDHARMVTFSQPMRTISIGNPAIADVNVIDRTHVLVLGKTYGATNIVGIDASGHATDDQVVVTDRPGGTVSVQRGIARTTLMCTSEHCEAAPAPGDDATSGPQRLADPPYDVLSAQAARREADATKAAGTK